MTNDPVVKGIHTYLKRDQRDIRLHISLNSEEHRLLKECADKAKVPVATFVRAASLFASALYHNARSRKVDDK